MEIIPLAAESLGVRSMATLVDTGSVRVLVDPGAALAPLRYGLPPTAAERQAYEDAVSCIIGTLCQVDAVVVTRYQDEHMNLLPYVLSSAAVYLKQPSDAAERLRARDLLQRLERTGRNFDLVSGRTVNWRDVSLTFSPPFPEASSGSGTVMAVAVRSGDRCFVHGSDAQGPLSPAAVNWILQQSPEVVYVSGAATYRMGHQDAPVTAAGLKTCRAHLAALLRVSGCRVILDHLLFRDPAGRRWFHDLFEAGVVQSAAGYLGLPDRLLEVQRRDTAHASVAALPPLDLEDPETSARREGAVIRIPTELKQRAPAGRPALAAAG